MGEAEQGLAQHAASSGFFFTAVGTAAGGGGHGVLALFAQHGFQVQLLVAEFSGGTGPQTHAFHVGGYLELFGRGGAVVGDDA